LTVPITLSPGRNGFTPQLMLAYDSGSGNGPFGLGWNIGLPQISRRTDRGLPKYFETDESDIFILSGAEDLVPALRWDEHGEIWVTDDRQEGAHWIRRYRPRIEGLFSYI